MAARKVKLFHDEEARARIKVGMIITKLEKCILEDKELTAQQVSSAKTLLAKVLPDLSHRQNDNETNVTFTSEDLERVHKGAEKYLANR